MIILLEFPGPIERLAFSVIHGLSGAFAPVRVAMKTYAIFTLEVPPKAMDTDQ